MSVRASVDHAARAAVARDVLSAGRTLVLPAEGLSMWPAVRPGRPVHVLPCDPDSLRVGDVVLLEGTEAVVLHRVVRLRGDRLVTKGDACPDADGWVRRDRVLGRLERRPWDRAAAWAAPWLGRVLVVAARRLG